MVENPAFKVFVGSIKYVDLCCDVLAGEQVGATEPNSLDHKACRAARNTENSPVLLSFVYEAIVFAQRGKFSRTANSSFESNCNLNRTNPERGIQKDEDCLYQRLNCSACWRGGLRTYAVPKVGRRRNLPSELHAAESLGRS